MKNKKQGRRPVRRVMQDLLATSGVVNAIRANGKGEAELSQKEISKLKTLKAALEETLTVCEH